MDIYELNVEVMHLKFCFGASSQCCCRILEYRKFGFRRSAEHKAVGCETSSVSISAWLQHEAIYFAVDAI